MNRRLRFLPQFILLSLLSSSAGAAGRRVSLMEDAVKDALRRGVSGATAKTHVAELARFHRVHASPGYHQAALYVKDAAERYGLRDVVIDGLPADDETRYNHFRAYYGWKAESGTLWEISPRRERIADFDEMRVALADYSQDADATAELVDVGAGTSDADYAGKDVSGKIVLAGGALPSVQREAVEKRGASGFVSYFPNQRTGWSGDDADLVRWGHLDPYNTRNRFAFMISLAKAREFQSRLARGETIRLEAHVRARMAPGSFEVVTGVIPGSEKPEEEIVFTCHLDHQSPGANDNASGAATLLEVARTLSHLVATGAIPAPRRTIRFVWPPEIAGTYAWLVRRPEIAARLRAGIHMDMVGGIPQTNKSRFFLSRPPDSLASFIGDVGEVFFDYVREGSRRAAASGDFTDAIVSREGTKEDWVAEVEGLSLGSDHQVLDDRFFGVPMLYFHDWPDVYIHTNKDRPEQMDATKLARVAFLGAASGYTLARVGSADAVPLAGEVVSRGLTRLGRDLERAFGLLSRSDGERIHDAYRDARSLLECALRREVDALTSMTKFTGASLGTVEPHVKALGSAQGGALAAASAFYGQLSMARSILPRRPSDVEPKDPPEARLVPSRTETVKGPIGIYYFDYLATRLSTQALEGALEGEVAYEVLNFVDGQKTARDIRDAVSAELGPVPMESVLAYLKLLERAEVVTLRSPARR